MNTPKQRSVVLVAHNLRSMHNVGSLLRSGEVFAVEKVWVTGFTPYPTYPGDERDAKLQDKQTRRMARAAAGAEQTMPLEHHPDVHGLLGSLREQGYAVAGLEIDPDAGAVADYPPEQKVALLLGDEVFGIDPSLREACDVLLQIPMYGQKFSLNVSVAAGIALYSLQTGAGNSHAGTGP